MTETNETENESPDPYHKVLQQLTYFEQRLDSQEELIANMMLAYSQLTSAMTVLASNVMGNTPEDIANFREQMAKQHEDMLGVLKGTFGDMAENDSSKSAQAFFNMAEEQSPGSASQ